MGQETMLIFGLIGVALLLIVAKIFLNQHKTRNELHRLNKKIEDGKLMLTEAIKDQEVHSEKWHTKLLVENHQQLNEEKEELHLHFTKVMEEFETQNDSIANEVIQLTHSLAAQDQKLETVKMELEEKQAALDLEYQQYQNYIEEQLRKVVGQNKPLPEQLDQLTTKLAQIKQLRQELTELQAPITIEPWREHRVVECNEEVGKYG